MDFEAACALARRIMLEKDDGEWLVLRVERSQERWLVVVRHIPSSETYWLHTVVHWQAVSNQPQV